MALTCYSWVWLLRRYWLCKVLFPVRCFLQTGKRSCCLQSTPPTTWQIRPSLRALSVTSVICLQPWHCPTERLGSEGSALFLSLVEPKQAYSAWAAHTGGLLCLILPIRGVTACSLASCHSRYHWDPLIYPVVRWLKWIMSLYQWQPS